MSLFGLAKRSLYYYWRANLTMLFGSAVAVAALTGSLLVGDSVRGTLHDLAIERLGHVQFTVSTPGFVREQLAAELIEAKSV